MRLVLSLAKVLQQAGAELCQPQEKLGLAKPALPSKNLRSSIKEDIAFVFYEPKI
jgi:hypothetical protein